MVMHLSARMDGLEQIVRDLHMAHQDVHKQLIQLDMRVAETDVRRQLTELDMRVAETDVRRQLTELALTARMEQWQTEAMERINALHVNQSAEATAEPQGWTWSHEEGRWQPQQATHQ